MKVKLSKNNILKILSENKNYLKTNFGVINIYLFGSYAKNLNTGKSDIDIMVDVIEEKKSIINRLNIKFYLENLLNKKVDIAYNESIHPLIKNNVLRDIISA